MLSRQKLGTFLLNKVLQNYKKWKNVIDKSCSTIHILGRENHFRKDLVEFWHWKWTLNVEKCRFSRVFNQTVLQGIKKSSGHVYWDVKSYWISYASLWNSTTVITLFPMLPWDYAVRRVSIYEGWGWWFLTASHRGPILGCSLRLSVNFSSFVQSKQIVTFCDVA